MIDKFLSVISVEMVAWLTWILIPVLVEIIPSIGNYVVLIRKFFRKKVEIDVGKLPDVSLIVPVYNSSGSLEACIAAVDASTYPNELIEVMLVDNMSTDNSFEIFQKCQIMYPNLSMQWMSSKQGKSKALNLALFNSNGKYIVNIDSDGKLEENALMNLISKFEADENVHCMTGVILTDPDMIKKTRNPFLKFMQRMEYLEYCHSFMAGRNFESERNNIFSLSGAFSAFRKSTILSTQMYNSSTLCEDAHLTLQVKKILKQKVGLCEDAIFITDPIESFGKLYTQRQRWQIGELEVIHMFYNKKKLKAHKFFTDGTIRMLFYDHTFAFPRMIWYFVLLALGLSKYDMSTIAGAVIAIYLLYVFISILYCGAISLFMHHFKYLRRQYWKKTPLLLFLPIYNLYVYFIRLAGIVNCVNRQSTWNTQTFAQERHKFVQQVKDDFTLKSFRTRKKDTGKRALISLVVAVVLIVNASVLMFFLQNNKETKIDMYKMTQSQVLYTIARQSNVASLNDMVSIINANKTSPLQRYSIYSIRDRKYIYYMDSPAGFIVDGKITDKLLSLDSDSDEVKDELGQSYLLSTNVMTMDGYDYIIGAVTPTEEVSGITGDGNYDKYIIMETCVLYIFVLVFYFNFLDGDLAYTRRMRKLKRDFEEYRAHSSINDSLDALKMQEDAVGHKEMGADNALRTESSNKMVQNENGVYSKEFYSRLKERLVNASTPYLEYPMELPKEDEELWVRILQEMNGMLLDTENGYQAMFINGDEKKIKKAMKKLKKGGKV